MGNGAARYSVGKDGAVSIAGGLAPNVKEHEMVLSVEQQQGSGARGCIAANITIAVAVGEGDNPRAARSSSSRPPPPHIDSPWPPSDFWRRVPAALPTSVPVVSAESADSVPNVRKLGKLRSRREECADIEGWETKSFGFTKNCAWVAEGSSANELESDLDVSRGGTGCDESGDTCYHAHCQGNTALDDPGAVGLDGVGIRDACCVCGKGQWDICRTSPAAQVYGCSYPIPRKATACRRFRTAPWITQTFTGLFLFFGAPYHAALDVQAATCTGIDSNAVAQGYDATKCAEICYDGGIWDERCLQKGEASEAVHRCTCGCGIDTGVAKWDCDSKVCWVNFEGAEN